MSENKCMTAREMELNEAEARGAAKARELAICVGKLFEHFTPEHINYVSDSNAGANLKAALDALKETNEFHYRAKECPKCRGTAVIDYTNGDRVESEPCPDCGPEAEQQGGGA